MRCIDGLLMFVYLALHQGMAWRLRDKIERETEWTGNTGILLDLSSILLQILIVCSTTGHLSARSIFGED
jgi:hypothetical protein